MPARTPCARSGAHQLHNATEKHNSSELLNTEICPRLAIEHRIYETVRVNVYLCAVIEPSLEHSEVVPWICERNYARLHLLLQQ